MRGAWQLGRYLRRHRIRLVHSFDTPMTASRRRLLAFSVLPWCYRASARRAC
jgi:hypothetical protein